MKRSVLLLGVFLVFSVFFISIASAELNNTAINNAYDCLEDKVENCSTSLDDNIFTLLSLKKCKNEVLKVSSSVGCWPTGACNIKQTAQAMLALKESNSNTTNSETWLFSHVKTPTNLEWFIEIESNSASTCSIDYSGHSYQISIGEDKKLSAGAGSCLSLAQDNYWLKISPSCQNYQYEISCNTDFTTSKLFKEQDSDTIHVTEEVNSASSGGITIEQVNSSCFADSTSCSYEGTLWAAMFLSSKNHDISPYIPYIVTMADNNPRVLPEAFLYILAGDAYRNDLLLKQKSSKYWEASGDRYYDTALALLALSSDDVSEKTNALDWLEEMQNNEGCWPTSIKDMGFLLYSISPRASSSDDGGGITTLPDCETAGYFCSSAITCNEAGGSIFDNYQCSSSFLECCSKKKEAMSCAAQGGEICTGSEQCVSGTVVTASDSTYAECCVGGICIVPDSGGSGGTEENSCLANNGICRVFECESGEQSDTTLSCDSSSEICCIKTGSKISYLWIWILVILIILLIIAILFRDKLRRFWLYIKTKFKKSPPGPPHHPGSYYPVPMRRMVPRRILPSSAPVHHRPVPSKRTGEFDEVLKKLKDMSR